MICRYEDLIANSPSQILCATAHQTYAEKDFSLRVGYSEADMDHFGLFLNEAQVPPEDERSYPSADNAGYYLDATVWFKDGTWARWIIPDSFSPGWGFYSCPQIPKELISLSAHNEEQQNAQPIEDDEVLQAEEDFSHAGDGSWEIEDDED